MLGIKDCPDFMTINEVAKYLRLSTATIYSLVKNQEIKSIKFGNRWRIPKESLIEYKNKVLSL